MGITVGFHLFIESKNDVFAVVAICDDCGNIEVPGFAFNPLPDPIMEVIPRPAVDCADEGAPSGGAPLGGFPSAGGLKPAGGPLDEAAPAGIDGCAADVGVIVLLLPAISVTG